MAKPYRNHREAALALLNGDVDLTPKAGGFLGHIAVDPSELTVKQSNWLQILLKRAGLPPLVGEVE